jgi:hypothetical protein
MDKTNYTILVLAILLTGCVNTSGKLEIKGKVTDKSTDLPIPGRNVIVQGLVLNNDKLVPVDAGQFSTDSSGSFEYSLIKIKDAYRYNFCLVGDSDYSFLTEELSLSFIKRNSDYLSFSLDKLSDLTILILRKSLTPAFDTLQLSWRTDGIDGRTMYPYKVTNNGLTSSSELRWIGGNVMSTVKTRVYADKMTTVRWVLFRNGRIKEIIDTITCKRDLVNEVHFIY